MTAIVEDANSSNLQKDSQQDMSMRDDSEMSQGDDSLVPTHATMAETFTDRLSQALESQMIHLKEAFNEQGLKVDEVEVTVAEFGLKKDGEGQEQTGSKQSGNRKFRPNESFSDEEKNEDLTTASERRDVNSMVDYTA